MIIEKKNGWIIISDIVDDQLVEQRYLFYTKEQAIKMFKEYIKTRKAGEL